MGQYSNYPKARVPYLQALKFKMLQRDIFCSCFDISALAFTILQI